jgi:hypothetical protein
MQMSTELMAAAATATHHHIEPRMAATLLKGAPARKIPKATNLANDESLKNNRLPGADLAGSGVSQAALVRVGSLT